MVVYANNPQMTKLFARSSVNSWKQGKICNLVIDLILEKSIEVMKILKVSTE